MMMTFLSNYPSLETKILYTSRTNGFLIPTFFLLSITSVYEAILIGLIFLVFFPSQAKDIEVHQQNMTCLSKVLENFNKFEAVMQKALVTIQESQIIARGYQLSWPLPPVTRLDNNGAMKAVTLRRAFLQAVLQVNLSLKSVLTSSLETYVNEDIALSNLKQLKQEFILCRSYFLWGLLKQFQSQCHQESFLTLHTFLSNLNTTMETEVSKLGSLLHPLPSSEAEASHTVESRLPQRNSTHRRLLIELSNLQLSLQSMAAKINFSQQLVIDEASTLGAQSCLESVKHELETLLSSWDTTWNRLLSYDDSNNISSRDISDLEDSSPAEPVDVAEFASILSQQLDVQEQTFEAYSDATFRKENDKKRKTKEAVQDGSILEQFQMIMELKNVLHARVIEKQKRQQGSTNS